MKMKKTRRKIGDVVKIRLDNNEICFGHVLKEPLVAFYDMKVEAESIVRIDDVVESPILFKVWVMNNAITSGRWEVIGNVELSESLSEPVTFFKQDRINKKVTLYDDSKDIPSTYQECLGLERASVWGANHIEDRLRDHYLGVENIWVKSLELEAQQDD
ncbi:immunity 26/phosphotriesterase HocA family protein [Vibrio neptunius]|uniref:immunity 26/phosphotriesterase HocA family protein n=1 Tax=Vibrio neptunius TaxID=170651 RepID=UPI001C5CB8D6|nr:immunity 26/phosphotriesterase HocA family protein [Vibrio neptunius]QXX08469.1 immunity 26/phosphotriesterase HocA family protein [Vibrio neptunius]